MIDKFIKQTIGLLKKSDIIIRPTVIRPVELNHEDNTQTVYMSGSDFYGGARLEDNFILQIMIMFSVMDALVDRKYPALGGESFHKKYKEMPDDTDEQIMFKEIYRLLKVLRNASIHSMNSVSLEADHSIVASYSYRETEFSLNISKNGMELIYTFIFNLINPPIGKLTNNHISGIQRTLFDHINRSVVTFSDEFGSALRDISDGLRLKRIVRYYVQNPMFVISNESIKITSEYKLHSDLEEHYGIDYQIEVNDKIAVLPSEVLIDNKIKLNNLEIWYKD
ncbi:hypothetical protein [Metabacillus fastidiosus]|uniref:hypothetical protein n=1 Tax=Metabacillus fastidiosus TaxID=1458 RepID=UPI003D2A30D6